MFDNSSIITFAVIAGALIGGSVIYIRMKILQDRLVAEHLQALAWVQEQGSRQDNEAWEDMTRLQTELEELRRNSLTDEEMAMYRIWRDDADHDFKRSQAKDDEPWPSPEEV
ncbi:hypothetical protein [Brevundimonas naejangsanensis]|uniref:hypothetical protein n=1 Tax=Brevundimonas naejangsanensis TaxID=588932 RepID=UPI003D030B92